MSLRNFPPSGKRGRASVRTHPDHGRITRTHTPRGVKTKGARAIANLASAILGGDLARARRCFLLLEKLGVHLTVASKLPTGVEA